MKFELSFQNLLITLLLIARLSSILTVDLDYDNRKRTGSHFDYTNPNKYWPEEFETCVGNRQSPINIDPYNYANVDLPPLEFLDYEKVPLSITVENNGHSVHLTCKWPKGDVPTIRGGPLDNAYEFFQLHFHWASQDNSGSEHTILEQSFPLELHVVHLNKKYNNVTEAVKNHDGFSVLGYLITIEDCDYCDNQNVGIENMITAFPEVLKPKQKTEINPFPLSAFNLKIMKQEYVTYMGSLTTPPCSESVIWLVESSSSLRISKKELDAFRNLQLNNYDSHNFRPTQPLNGRKVYYAQKF